jgi:hypothetical protein
MSRNPPPEVREILRKGVNFGCPVKDCGEPYLEYHHFDPTWKEKQHHNPNGMIALCREHHLQANETKRSHGAWTKEQLRDMKSNPYVKTELVGKFNWLRQDLVVIAGLIVHNPQIIATIKGEKVVWMRRDADGYNRLNMLVKDSNGKILLSMIDNDWIAYNKNAIDIICPPSGKELSIFSKDKKTFLSIRFDDVSIIDFEKRLYELWDYVEKLSEKDKQESLKRCEETLIQKGLSSDEVKRLIQRSAYSWLEHRNLAEEREQYVHRTIAQIGNPERITTCTLNACLEYQQLKIEIEEGILRCGGLRIYRGFIGGGSGTAYSLG